MIAIYARQSIDRENSISIDAQIAHCENIIDPAADTKTYIDKGYSGSNINRPAFEQLLADIKIGSVTAVYCYRLDRISRNILDFANLQEYFKKYGCAFVSSSESLDTSSPMGRAMINIIMVFAQLERETIAGRIKDAYFARAKIGAYLGGGMPLGYTTEKRVFDGKEMSILIPGDTAEIVKDIFRMYTAQRTSLTAIAKMLNDKGIKTSKGNPFRSHGVRRILRNPLYTAATPDIYDYYLSQGCSIYNTIDDFSGVTGCLLVGKFINKNIETDIKDQQLIVSAHEPLVDSDTFLAAQHALARNYAMKRKGTGQITWVTGFVKCGECGYAVTTKTSRSYSYLACRGHDGLGENVCAQAKHFNVKDIESEIERQLFDRLKSMDLKQIKNDPPPKRDIETRQQISKISQQIDKLLDAVAQAEGSTASQYLIKKIEELDAEKARLSAMLMDSDAPNNNAIIASAEKILSGWDSADVRTRNHLASMFIKAVYLTPSTTQIEWII
jgi:DNA invertase Pin-like site-specific DNA recombinase